MVTRIQSGKRTRRAMVGGGLLVSVVFALVAGTSPALSTAEGSGTLDERGRTPVVSYCGPFTGGAGGICVDRRKGSVRVQVLGLCTNVRSPKIRIRGGKIDAKKNFRYEGKRVKLRIKGKFSPNQKVIRGKVKMTWGDVACTGGDLLKFKARA